MLCASAGLVEFWSSFSASTIPRRLTRYDPSGLMCPDVSGAHSVRSLIIVARRMITGRVPVESLGLGHRDATRAQPPRLAHDGQDRRVIGPLSIGQPTFGVATTRRMVRLPDGTASAIATSLMDTTRARAVSASIAPNVGEPRSFTIFESRLDAPVGWSDGRPTNLDAATVSRHKPWIDSRLEGVSQAPTA